MEGICLRTVWAYDTRCPQKLIELMAEMLYLIVIEVAMFISDSVSDLTVRWVTEWISRSECHII